MAPPASILFPTRDRLDYLAVALASVAPQAAVHGAEIVIVEDDAENPATAALAARHGARYVALGRKRGINVARNAAVHASTGELACFLDDDVEVWPAGSTRCSRPHRASTRSAGRSGPGSKAPSCGRAGASRCP